MELFFREVKWPDLKQQDLDDLVLHARRGDFPRWYGAEERRACDPETIARLIHDADLGKRARTDLLIQRYNELARSIYPHLRDFQAAVSDQLHWLNFPDEVASAAQVAPVCESAAYGRPRLRSKVAQPLAGCPTPLPRPWLLPTLITGRPQSCPFP